MTKAPITVSNGHGFLHDMLEWQVALWTDKHEDGQTLAACVCVNNDQIDIEATNSAGNKIGYYTYYAEGGASNLSLSSTVYTKCRWRFKCSGSTMRAKIVLCFSTWNFGDTEANNIAAGNGQIVLAETGGTTMKSGVTTITTGKTIDHVRLYCNAGIGHVYYDFMMIYKDDFSLPNTKYGKTFSPLTRNVFMIPPGMSGAMTNNLGSELASFNATCDLDIGNWLRTGDTVVGQVFMDIVHNNKTEPFQWIDTGDDVAQFKVTLEEPHFIHEGSESETSHRLELKFKEFRQSPANDETTVERWGLDL